jgi:hypothetical protein
VLKRSAHINQDYLHSKSPAHDRQGAKHGGGDLSLLEQTDGFFPQGPTGGDICGDYRQPDHTSNHQQGKIPTKTPDPVEYLDGEKITGHQTEAGPDDGSTRPQQSKFNPYLPA